ncbi:helix-turn-helix domain-containing protein [Brucella pituitosa]|uniref:helix-turn-helix domain-containing protein n=1 Tax=Brucella pituitosa TaxID=571256 RepID=UPI00200589FF|nr:helix-turn-helix domain-containing protein [Brucella pituitosa]MCK4204252.1 helix-turn-helix domain-containing protein [Brucella pituitosa]
MSEPRSGKDFARARQIWIDQVGDDHELSATAFKVAHHLSHYFNRDQFLDAGCMNAWPSYEMLASKVGCGTSTVKRAINELRARKHVETTGGRGRSQTLQYRAKIKPKVVQSGGLNDHDKTMQNWPLNEEKEVKSASEKRSNLHEKGVRNDLQPLLNKYLDKNAGAREGGNPVTLHPQSVEAQCEPYNPEWALVVFEGLSKGPGVLPRPATGFLRKLIEIDRSPLQILDHQARHGWPEINRMFEWPKALDLASVPPVIRPMALEMELVASGSALWAEWRDEFEARGWPFPREAKRMAFPRGGSRALPGFLTAMQARKWGYPDKVVSLMSRAGNR